MPLISVDINEVITLSLATLIPAAIIGLYTYFKRRLHCIDIVAEHTKKVDDRSLRQSHAMVLIAQKLDNLFQNQTSPKNTNFSQEIESALKDEKGNL